MSEQTKVHALRRPGHETQPETYRMFVRDLVLPCLIGVHRHEQDGRQPVRINLDLEVVAGAPTLDDRLANVASYETLVKRIRELTGDGHVNLVETLAGRIADICLTDSRVLSARVTVEKLEVFPDAASAGVEIVRNRRNH
jgi:dihydroneopterin aldolase